MSVISRSFVIGLSLALLPSAGFAAGPGPRQALPAFTTLPLSDLGPDADAQRSSPRAHAHEGRLLLAWVEHGKQGAAIMARPAAADAPLGPGAVVVVARLPDCATTDRKPTAIASLTTVAGRFAMTWTHCGASWLGRASDPLGATWSEALPIHDGTPGATPAVVGASGEAALVAWAVEDARVGAAPAGGIAPDPARRVLVRRLDASGSVVGADRAVWSRGEVPSDDMEKLTPIAWVPTDRGPALVLRFMQDMRGQYGHKVIRARDPEGGGWDQPETVWQYGVGNSRMGATSPVFEAGGGLAATQVSWHPAGHFGSRLALDPPGEGRSWSQTTLEEMTWSRPLQAASTEPYEPAWAFVTASPAAGGSRIALAALSEGRGDGRLVVQTALGERATRHWKSTKPLRISKKHRLSTALWMDVAPATQKRAAYVRLLGLTDAGDLLFAVLPLPAP